MYLSVSTESLYIFLSQPFGDRQRVPKKKLISMDFAKNKIYNNEGIFILLIGCDKAAKIQTGSYMGLGRKICIATHGTTADKNAIKGRKICIVTHGME